jgi:hypothetical protein
VCSCSQVAHPPAYRHTFVGRQAELRQLQAAFDGTLAGQGALIMVLGEAAVMLGRVQEAKAFYVQGLEVCRKVAFRPEVALICLDLAQLRLEHFPAERAEALSSLDFAIVEFEAMHMAPSLERARALARTLQSKVTASPPSEIDVLTRRERAAAG